VTRRSTSETRGPRTLVEDATAHRRPPGLVAAVVAADGVVEFVTSGLADVRTLRPVTAHTTFPWFSIEPGRSATSSRS
jgi:CubicO group peptidase (beta-lactamase class C family)